MNNFPEYVNHVLPVGIHQCSGMELIEKFCVGEQRRDFVKPVADILDFAKARHARYLFFAGSFVTDAPDPRDIDCLMVFAKAEYIPAHTERLALGLTKLDIQFSSEDQRAVTDSFIHFFSHNRYGQEVGIVQVDLYEKSGAWKIQHEPDETTVEIVKQVYSNRQVIDLNQPKGILVTIHGVNSNGPWNNEIAPIASSQGWIFAPFTYETNSPTLLVDAGLRTEVVEQFRDWIYSIWRRYQAPVSVLAHSFGTYVIMSYITGFEKPPVEINGLVLTGCILNPSFDWNKYAGKSVGKILNMKSPNDEWVKMMPETDWKKFIGMDTRFGKAGQSGFTIECTALTQSENAIFTHTNTIKKDVVETMWMPFFNANKDAVSLAEFEEFRQMMKAKNFKEN